jgi:hypothetical protein
MKRPPLQLRVRPYRLPLDAAHALWAAREHLAATKLIFEAMEPADRVAWVEHVVRFCTDLCGSTPEASAFLELAAQPEQWHEARGFFERLGSLSSLPVSQLGAPPQARELLAEIIYLATKVTYNATGGPAPYDHNAGWKIGPVFAKFLDGLNNPHAAQLGTRALLRNPRRHAA